MREPTRFHTPQPSGFAADVPPASFEGVKSEAFRDEEHSPTLAPAELVEAPPLADEGADRLPPGKPESLLGCTIDGRYKVESVLGEGGMGVVYRCRHTMIDKRVAMKVLRSDLARDEEVTERFLQEAKAASGIGHEHIIDIHDFGHLPDGATYFVMEYLEGQSLSEAAPRGSAFSVARILHIARQIAQGLAAAHEAGIVHRDLKPDNVFLTTRGTDEDFVKILDFGIAKVSTSPTGQLTRAGAVFGTPHYMSPEQSSGAPVDHRGDIYSLGVILYEIACGKVPFDADNFMGILTQHMYKAPVPLRALVPPPDVSPGFEAVVLKCLSKRPEQRYPTMSELILDLDAVAEGLTPRAVGDLLRRSSAGFRVPQDYFKTQTRIPAIVPGAPRPTPRGVRWPIVAAALGVLGGVALTAAVMAHDRPARGVPASVPEAKAPAVSAPASDASLRQAVKVAIAVEPIDAEVFRGTESLGSSPVVVEVPPGGTVSVDVRSKGYVARAFVLDGAEPKLTVRLERDGNGAKASAIAKRHAPQPASVSRQEAAPAPQKPKPASSEGIQNPWQ